MKAGRAASFMAHRLSRTANFTSSVNLGSLQCLEKGEGTARVQLVQVTRDLCARSFFFFAFWSSKHSKYKLYSWGF